MLRRLDRVELPIRILYFLNLTIFKYETNADVFSHEDSYSYLISLVWVVEQLPQGTGYKRKHVSLLR